MISPKLSVSPQGPVIASDIYHVIRIGLIQAVGFGDMEIIARHVLCPEELQGMAQCPGSDFTPSPLPEDLAAVVGKVLSIKFRATR